jgi:hypothetical protein
MQLNLWPNPCIDKVNFTIETPLAIKTSYAIYNSSGHLVLRNKIDLNSGVNIIAVNTQRLQRGLYLLIAEDGSDARKNLFRFYRQ